MSFTSALPDLTTFQQQVVTELRPLYLKEQSPLAALRLRSETANSVAWLGPAVLVGVAALLVMVIIPLVGIVSSAGYGIWVAVLVPIPLLGIYFVLQRRRQQELDTKREQQRHIIRELETLQPGSRDEWQHIVAKLDEHKKLTLNEEIELLTLWERIGLEQGKALLQQAAVRDALCPILQPQPRDVMRLAQVVVPVLYEEVEEGRLDVPLVPVLFAGATLTIHRDGAAAFCAEPTDDPATDTLPAPANDADATPA